MEKKTTDDEQRPKFNLLCIGNVKDNKTLIMLSEKAQPDQKWSTTTLKHAPFELQRKWKTLLNHKQNIKE